MRLAVEGLSVNFTSQPRGRVWDFGVGTLKVDTRPPSCRVSPVPVSSPKLTCLDPSSGTLGTRRTGTCSVTSRDPEVRDRQHPSPLGDTLTENRVHVRGRGKSPQTTCTNPSYRSGDEGVMRSVGFPPDQERTRVTGTVLQVESRGLSTGVGRGTCGRHRHPWSS